MEAGRRLPSDGHRNLQEERRHEADDRPRRGVHRRAEGGSAEGPAGARRLPARAPVADNARTPRSTWSDRAQPPEGGDPGLPAPAYPEYFKTVDASARLGALRRSDASSSGCPAWSMRHEEPRESDSRAFRLNRSCAGQYARRCPAINQINNAAASTEMRSPGT